MIGFSVRIDRYVDMRVKSLDPPDNNILELPSLFMEDKKIGKFKGKRINSLVNIWVSSMSNYREKLKDIAYLVNDELTAYITIHDKIFKEAATVRSFIRNIFGHAVPMSQLLQDVETLIPLWNGIIEKIDSFSREADFLLDEDEKYYFEILSRYAQAVNKTVVALVERQRLLNERSKGGRDNPVDWNVYQDADKIYQTAIQKYMTIGQELNNAGHLIF